MTTQAQLNLLRADLKRDEGIRLKPYKCSAGKLTIGVGRNIEDRGITEEESEVLLNTDIALCILDLQKNFKWYEKLDFIRQNAMINMCFNLGITRLLGFKKFINSMEVSDYSSAGFNMMDSKWAVQVGDRAKRLRTMIVHGDDNGYI
jgi:lysozyme